MSFSSSSPPLTMKVCILRINNDGVSLLRSGRNKAAMFRLARCLAIMKNNVTEGEREVSYRYIRSLIPISANITTGTNNSDPRYIFMSPIEAAAVVSNGDDNDKDDDEMMTEYSFSSSKIDDNEKQTCKLLSIVLFNLSLAHHLYALDLKEQTIQVQQQQCKYNNNDFQNNEDKIHQYQEVRSILDRALRLYQLCHSSLVFTNSGILCSDLSLAIVVTNNVGEIHKEFHQQEEEQDEEQYTSQQQQQPHQDNDNIHQCHDQPKKERRQECSRTALACSQQLVQIFMFFTANGESEFLGCFGDILSNAIAMLNGPQVVAAAA
jgi:hypothetical protein